MLEHWGYDDAIMVGDMGAGRALRVQIVRFPAVVTYIVQPGDTLAEIAGQFGVTVEAIVEANNIEDANIIHVGQVLSIPSPCGE